MIVTPVAKHPIAFRNSAEFKVITRRRKRLHYHGLTLYDSIHVAVTAITSAVSENRSACAAALAGLRPGVPISRAAAVQLIGCPDELLPSLLAAARAAKERFKPGVITYSRKVFLPL